MFDNDSEDHMTSDAAVAPISPVTPISPIGPIDPVGPISPVPIPVPVPVPVSPTGGPIPLSPSSPSTTSTTPSVAVTVPNATGTVRFELVVTDNLGVQSTPAYATVTIQGPPIAVIAATPATVAEGGTITLSGAGSSSSGSIAQYVFTLVPVGT